MQTPQHQRPLPSSQGLCEAVSTAAGRGAASSPSLATVAAPLPPHAIPQPPALHSSAAMRGSGSPAAWTSMLSPPPVGDASIMSTQSTASGIGVRDVAELVRQLAESRHISRQLQERVREMELSAASPAATAQTVTALITSFPAGGTAEAGRQAARRRHASATTGRASAHGNTRVGSSRRALTPQPRRCASSRTSSLGTTASARATSSTAASTSSTSSVSRSASTVASATASVGRTRRRVSRHPPATSSRTRSAPERSRPRRHVGGCAADHTARRRRREASEHRGQTRTRRGRSTGRQTTTPPPPRHGAHTAHAEARHDAHRHRRERGRSTGTAAGAAPPSLATVTPPSRSSAKEERAARWRRRYYALLSWHADEAARRDADLVDIHEMIELLSWEHDRRRPRPGQQHISVREVRPPHEDGSPARDVPVEVTPVVGDGGDTAREVEHPPMLVAAAAPAAAVAAAAPARDAVQEVEMLRGEADAWRQRCFALLQQPPPPPPPPPPPTSYSRLDADTTWVSDAASVAPLPPRPSAGESTSTPRVTGMPTSADRDGATASSPPPPPPQLSPPSWSVGAHAPQHTLSHPYAPASASASASAPPHTSSSSLSPALSAILRLDRQSVAAPPSRLPGSATTHVDFPLWSPQRPSPAAPPLFMGVPGYRPARALRSPPDTWTNTPPYTPPAAAAAAAAVAAAAAAPSAGEVRHPGASAPLFTPAAATPSSGPAAALPPHDHVADVPVECALPDTVSRGAPPPSSSLSSFLHRPPAASPTTAAAAEAALTRERLEHDIRRHDQLLAAIHKLQRTAAAHATRHTA
ncbi:hypothetical protein NESM_000321900 [Novymonas esmeraldas]|uniref:Uncharacterized protein n=1 Tax=Novymonas esmeraldas TaxID=1808958 RepID=A0AAW0EL14_9TRYP